MDPNFCETNFFLNGNKQKIENPSIILNFVNENKTNKFVVWHEDSDYQITIGDSYKNDITLVDSFPDHCTIQFSHENQVWFVSDSNNIEKKDCYRTFIQTTEKGVRLKEGMKFFINEHVFLVEEYFKE